MPWNPLHCVCIVSKAFIGYDLDPAIKAELKKQGLLRQLEEENKVSPPPRGLARRYRLEYPYYPLQLHPLD